MAEGENFDFFLFPSPRIMREYLRRINYSGSLLGWITKQASLVLLFYAFAFAIVSLDQDGLGGKLVEKYAYFLMLIIPFASYLVVITDVRKRLARKD